MRGKWAEPLDINALKINMTSAQAKKSANRIQFSPMQEIEAREIVAQECLFSKKICKDFPCILMNFF